MLRKKNASINLMESSSDSDVEDLIRLVPESSDEDIASGITIETPFQPHLPGLDDSFSFDFINEFSNADLFSMPSPDSIDEDSHVTGLSSIKVNYTSSYTDSSSKIGNCASRFVIPASFFDIPSNLAYLTMCKPLYIKLIDCKRYPSYLHEESGRQNHLEVKVSMPIYSQKHSDECLITKTTQHSRNGPSATKQPEVNITDNESSESEDDNLVDDDDEVVEVWSTPIKIAPKAKYLLECSNEKSLRHNIIDPKRNTGIVGLKIANFNSFKSTLSKNLDDSQSQQKGTDFALADRNKIQGERTPIPLSIERQSPRTFEFTKTNCVAIELIAYSSEGIDANQEKKVQNNISGNVYKKEENENIYCHSGTLTTQVSPSLHVKSEPDVIMYNKTNEVYSKNEANIDKRHFKLKVDHKKNVEKCIALANSNDFKIDVNPSTSDPYTGQVKNLKNMIKINECPTISSKETDENVLLLKEISLSDENKSLTAIPFSIESQSPHVCESAKTNCVAVDSILHSSEVIEVTKKNQIQTNMPENVYKNKENENSYCYSSMLRTHESPSLHVKLELKYEKSNELHLKNETSLDKKHVKTQHVPKLKADDKKKLNKDVALAIDPNTRQVKKIKDVKLKEYTTISGKETTDDDILPTKKGTFSEVKSSLSRHSNNVNEICEKSKKPDSINPCNEYIVKVASSKNIDIGDLPTKDSNTLEKNKNAHKALAFRTNLSASTKKTQLHNTKCDRNSMNYIKNKENSTTKHGDDNIPDSKSLSEKKRTVAKINTSKNDTRSNLSVSYLNQAESTYNENNKVSSNSMFTNLNGIENAANLIHQYENECTKTCIKECYRPKIIDRSNRQFPEISKNEKTNAEKNMYTKKETFDTNDPHVSDFQSKRFKISPVSPSICEAVLLKKSAVCSPKHLNKCESSEKNETKHSRTSNDVCFYEKKQNLKTQMIVNCRKNIGIYNDDQKSKNKVGKVENYKSCQAQSHRTKNSLSEKKSNSKAICNTSHTSPPAEADNFHNKYIDTDGHLKKPKDFNPMFEKKHVTRKVGNLDETKVHGKGLDMTFNLSKTISNLVKSIQLPVNETGKNQCNHKSKSSEPSKLIQHNLKSKTSDRGTANDDKSKHINKNNKTASKHPYENSKSLISKQQFKQRRMHTIAKYTNKKLSCIAKDIIPDKVGQNEHFKKNCLINNEDKQDDRRIIEIKRENKPGNTQNRPNMVIKKSESSKETTGIEAAHLDSNPSLPDNNRKSYKTKNFCNSKSEVSGKAIKKKQPMSFTTKKSDFTSKSIANICKQQRKTRENSFEKTKVIPNQFHKVNEINSTPSIEIKKTKVYKHCYLKSSACEESLRDSKSICDQPKIAIGLIGEKSNKEHNSLLKSETIRGSQSISTRSTNYKGSMSPEIIVDKQDILKILNESLNDEVAVDENIKITSFVSKTRYHEASLDSQSSTLVEEQIPLPINEITVRDNVFVEQKLSETSSNNLEIVNTIDFCKPKHIESHSYKGCHLTQTKYDGKTNFKLKNSSSMSLKHEVNAKNIDLSQKDKMCKAVMKHVKPVDLQQGKTNCSTILDIVSSNNSIKQLECAESSVGWNDNLNSLLDSNVQKISTSNTALTPGSSTKQKVDNLYSPAVLSVEIFQKTVELIGHTQKQLISKKRRRHFGTHATDVAKKPKKISLDEYKARKAM